MRPLAIPLSLLALLTGAAVEPLASRGAGGGRQGQRRGVRGMAAIQRALRPLSRAGRAAQSGGREPAGQPGPGRAAPRTRRRSPRSSWKGGRSAACRRSKESVTPEQVDAMLRLSEGPGGEADSGRPAEGSRREAGELGAPLAGGRSTTAASPRRTGHRSVSDSPCLVRSSPRSDFATVSMSKRHGSAAGRGSPARVGRRARSRWRSDRPAPDAPGSQA